MTWVEGDPDAWKRGTQHDGAFPAEEWEDLLAELRALERQFTEAADACEAAMKVMEETADAMRRLMEEHKRRP